MTECRRCLSISEHAARTLAKTRIAAFFGVWSYFAPGSHPRSGQQFSRMQVREVCLSIVVPIQGIGTLSEVG